MRHLGDPVMKQKPIDAFLFPIPGTPEGIQKLRLRPLQDLLHRLPRFVGDDAHRFAIAALDEARPLRGHVAQLDQFPCDGSHQGRQLVVCHAADFADEFAPRTMQGVSKNYISPFRTAM
jgi:hypothetical protein